MGRPKAAEVQKRRTTKKGKDPNKPKRSTSAYFYFLAHCREEANKAGRSISKIAEFTKECSEKWKVMTETTKRPFEEKAATDKARYTREMASYSGKSKKDEGKPKRPQSAYFLFLADFRTKMKGKNIDHKEILKLAGEEWRKLTAEKKQPYENASQKEQKKYEAALSDWRKGGGGAKQNANGTDDDEDEMEEDEEDEEEEEDDDDDDDE
ncbi:hypothetical protein ACJMK2_016926 [Sinanodonta woodiana]|uniref:HMG box domain-containing protein n=1 Tax=Sinanodonta woodiana TaxID=1069815 RepID=A0ABD3UWC7_SINWO